MASAAGSKLPAQNSAIAAIQNARKGRSVSSELPFTTNAGTARNSSAAHNGCGEKRRASRHMAHAAISENRMYAVWNGTSFTSPKIASSPARIHASIGGCERQIGRGQVL